MIFMSWSDKLRAAWTKARKKKASKAMRERMLAWHEKRRERERNEGGKDGKQKI